MATLAAIRWNPTIRPHYLHLVEAGKRKKVALVACMQNDRVWRRTTACGAE